MSKVAVLLGIAAIAMAPSFASAKSYGHSMKPKHHYAMHHHGGHHPAKMEAKATGPNDNTYKLFSGAFK